MSESAGHHTSLSSLSSISSISLVEIKAETQLVIQAFLRRTLATTPKDRPGRVGGAFKDHYKYSSTPQPNPKDEHDSQAEDVSSADEKKHRFKYLIKLPHHSTRRPASRDHIADDAISPSSASEEDESEKKQQRKLSRKKLRRKLSMFFKLKSQKEKEKDIDDRALPQRPSTLAIDVIEPRPEPAIISPNHPPEFYDGVAERLEQIGQRSTSIQSPTTPSSPTCEKDLVVQELVHVLSLEGDAMNIRINSNPFLRNSLARLSFASYTRLLDTFGGSQVAEAPALQPTESPTLRRMAVTMEVSRRIVQATGPQRMQGFAERYMDRFGSWVKSQGGWENVVHLEEPDEYN